VRGLVPYPPVRTMLRLEITGSEARDFSYLEHLFSDFLSLKLVDSTAAASDLWAREEEDSLAGIFLRNLRSRMVDACPEEKQMLQAAAAFGLAALENREQPSVNNGGDAA